MRNENKLLKLTYQQATDDKEKIVQHINDAFDILFESLNLFEVSSQQNDFTFSSQDSAYAKY